jgi:hypothetical protein
MDGRVLRKIQERMLHLRDSMEIEGPDGWSRAISSRRASRAGRLLIGDLGPLQAGSTGGLLTASESSDSWKLRWDVS